MSINKLTSIDLMEICNKLDLRSIINFRNCLEYEWQKEAVSQTIDQKKQGYHIFNTFKNHILFDKLWSGIYPINTVFPVNCVTDAISIPSGILHENNNGYEYINLYSRNSVLINVPINDKNIPRINNSFIKIYQLFFSLKARWIDDRFKFVCNNLRYIIEEYLHIFTRIDGHYNYIRLYEEFYESFFIWAKEVEEKRQIYQNDNFKKYEFDILFGDVEWFKELFFPDII
tara:strand:+ start:33 stop:719 length:687 start_codon:yes stop_codon:yes gene_type:complete